MSRGREAEGVAAARSPRSRVRPGILAALASVRLTLWLLAILAIAMAVATIIPQRATAAAYERAFGAVAGHFIHRTTLRNIYASWWFIGAFALLAVNLTACGVQRASRLLRRSHPAVDRVTREHITSRPHHLTWSLDASAVDRAADDLARRLRRLGYSVRSLAPTGREKAFVARRGALGAWGPVLVHLGLVVVLLGAAYGRFPAHSYRAVAELEPGQPFTVRAGPAPFSLQLLDAGQEIDPEGHPTRFWARVDVLEDGKPVASSLIEPNRPLIRHGVVAILQALPPPSYAIEITSGDSTALVPIVFTRDGAVAPLDSAAALTDPPWIVFTHSFRPAHSGSGPAASVFRGSSDANLHDWQPVGWVTEKGLTDAGVRFKLVSSRQGAQFLLDRDIGVPIVWAGFVLVVLGSLLAVGLRRASLTALVFPTGRSWRVLAGASGRGADRDLERLREQTAADAAPLSDRSGESPT